MPNVVPIRTVLRDLRGFQVEVGQRMRVGKVWVEGRARGQKCRTPGRNTRGKPEQSQRMASAHRHGPGQWMKVHEI
jgi:hypothetical protein